MQRQILHLRVASFPVAVYRVKDPSLRTRPLIVANGRGPRAVALSVSREARQEGARPGMTLPEALRWCRGALVLPPDPILFEQAERALAEILARYSPRVEPVRGGRLYADLTGTERLLGHAADVARRAQKEIDQRLRLGPSAGLAANKLVSGVAAQVLGPVPLLDVRPGDEAGFLSPLMVRCLPAVDPRTEGALLDELNIHKVRDLAAVDLPRLNLAFGVRAIALYRQARGIDESPVHPPDRTPAVEADESLAVDTNDDALLLSCLYALVERCGARLRRLSLPAGEGTLTARYTDGVTVTRKTAIAPVSAGDLTLYAHLRPLFEQVVQRRGRVRYLRVRFTRLTPASAPAQMTLFDAGGADGEPALIAALDRIRGKFGAGAIAFGRAGRGRTHRAA
ncbi:MAG TPA: DNA polymerase IV [Candidatus Polarisedimenticolia bacterium]|jgi:DNA polymerase-4